VLLQARPKGQEPFLVGLRELVNRVDRASGSGSR
jgi:hypothetical protein